MRKISRRVVCVRLQQYLLNTHFLVYRQHLRETRGLICQGSALGLRFDAIMVFYNILQRVSFLKLLGIKRQMAEGVSAILLFNPLIFNRLIDWHSFYTTFHPTFYILSSGTGSLLTLDQSSACTETSRAFANGPAVQRMPLKGRALLV